MCQPGPARAPRRLPRRLAGLGRLPQREVDRRCACARRRRRARPRSRAAPRRVRCDSSPYSASVSTWKYTPLPLDDVRVPARDELGDQLRSSRRSTRSRAAPRRDAGCSGGRTASRNSASYLRDELGLGASPRSCARAMIWSSTSVTLLTYVHVEAAPHEIAPDRVEHDLLAAVPEVRHVVRRRAAHVHRHLPVDARHEVDLGALSGVVDAEHASEASRVGVDADDSSDDSPVRQQRDGPHRDAFGPADRAEPSARLGRTDDRDAVRPSAGAPARARRRGSSPSPSMCGARRGVSAATATSTLSTHQPVVAHPLRDVGEQRQRVGAAVALVVGGEQRAEIGQAGRAEQRVGDRVRDDVAVGVAREARRVGDRARRRARAAAGRRTGCTSKPSPTRFLTCVLLRCSACASSRSSASVSLRLRRSPSTTTTVPPRPRRARRRRCRRRRSRARRAARRRGTPAASAPRRDRHAARSRRPRRSRTRFTVSTTGSAGTAASAPSRDRVDHRARTTGATRAGAPRRARPRRRRRRERARARRARSRSGSRRRSSVRTPVGRVPLASAGSTTTTPSHDSARDADRPVEHGRAAEARELLRRAEARAATGRDDDRPRRARGQSGVISRVEAGEQEAAGRRRHDRRHLQHHLGAADEFAAAVHDDHRAVVEVADALAVSLPSRVSETRTKSPGPMEGVSSCASLRRLHVGTPCSSALRASGPSLVSSRSCNRRASAISLASTSCVLGHLVVEHEQRARCRRVAARRASRGRGARAGADVVGRVGEPLHLVEHEARHHEIAAEHTGARQAASS